MKKLSMLMAFMLTALVASAQSLVGSWVTDLGDSDKEPMLCTITYNADNSLVLNIRSDINDPDMGVITLAITVKGIYKQKGKTLTLKFDKNSLDLKIAKMNLKPEMKQALEDNPALREKFENLIGEALKEGSKTMVDECPLNGDTTIKELTAKHLVLVEEGDTVIFTRK
jgi:hypothetical protein